METTSGHIINLVYKTSFFFPQKKQNIYVYRKHKRERDRGLQKKKERSRGRKMES